MRLHFRKDDSPAPFRPPRGSGNPLLMASVLMAGSPATKGDVTMSSNTYSSRESPAMYGKMMRDADTLRCYRLVRRFL